MNRLSMLLTSLGLGAGLMYFYDPNRGNRRRALVRDQWNSMLNSADDALDKAAQDTRNQIRGVLAEATGMFSDEGAPDWLLVERTRARLGRYISHPSALQVEADRGRIILSGPILKNEVDTALKQASRVRGVRQVENRMDVHDSPGDIPALQGGYQRKNVPEWQEENWSPSMRLISGAGGGLLALYGMSRRGLIGTTLSLAGLTLAARGVTNLNFGRMLGIGDARNAITVQKAINIDAPIDQLYSFWENFENFPRFMQHVIEVKNLGNDRSHWVVEGPAGSKVEWDAMMTENIPNQVIGWRSEAGSEVMTSGEVQFRENPGGGTRITIHFHYTPPAGIVGHAVATIFGDDPKQAMDEDLARLKSLFEDGKTTVRGREVTLQEVPGTGA